MYAQAKRAPSEFQRNAFAPAVLAAIVLLAGIALVDKEFYLAVRFIVAILAVIIGWFAVQARQWWWALPMLGIAVAWNPVYPLPLNGPAWIAAHIVAAGVCVVAGALIKTPRAVAK
ncbi:hypothetical protein DEA06_16090 [Microbacterium sp. Gd 4-13]|uniref:DUF6804 family protein n=1 Tax=Microbacterium sp. Gd 4-13 TaxID=2173179 RepID=UPI000D56A8A6|nr:DUF6804 family protein [Microbacterium sp. Gd 4-13]PVW02012.1 hypothetical protein DEA06_16090 [Microbacterium sp. Gd 4-13]